MIQANNRQIDVSELNLKHILKTSLHPGNTLLEKNQFHIHLLVPDNLKLQV